MWDFLLLVEFFCLRAYFLSDFLVLGCFCLVLYVFVSFFSVFVRMWNFLRVLGSFVASLFFFFLFWGVVCDLICGFDFS